MDHKFNEKIRTKILKRRIELQDDGKHAADNAKFPVTLNHFTDTKASFFFARKPLPSINSSNEDENKNTKSFKSPANFKKESKRLLNESNIRNLKNVENKDTFSSPIKKLTLSDDIIPTSPASPMTSRASKLKAKKLLSKHPENFIWRERRAKPLLAPIDIDYFGVGLQQNIETKSNVGEIKKISDEHIHQSYNGKYSRLEPIPTNISTSLQSPHQAESQVSTSILSDSGLFTTARRHKKVTHPKKNLRSNCAVYENLTDLTKSDQNESSSKNANIYKCLPPLDKK